MNKYNQYHQYNKYAINLLLALVLSVLSWQTIAQSSSKPSSSKQSSSSQTQRKTKYPLPIKQVKSFINKMDDQIARKKLEKLLISDYQTNPGILKIIDRLYYKKYPWKRPKSKSKRKHQKKKVSKKTKSKKKPKKNLFVGIRPIRWRFYEHSFVEPKRITNGANLYATHEQLFLRAEREYQVNRFIILAILGIETRYGLHKGSYPVLNALTALSFHPHSYRKRFFQKELKHFLLLAEKDPSLYQVQGSYAGAMGLPQFMPSSIKHFAVDYNSDNQIDLIHSLEDSVASIANYLKKNHWNANYPVALRVKNSYRARKTARHYQTRRTKAKYLYKRLKLPLNGVKSSALSHFRLFHGKRGKELWILFNNFRVLKSYNNSNGYAMAVHKLSLALKKHIRKKHKLITIALSD